MDQSNFSVGGDPTLFVYEGRYDIDLSYEERRQEWEDYWRFLESISIAQDSELWTLFVEDVFQGGVVDICGIDLFKRELKLSIENTARMNLIHELRGDKWACKHIQREDFATELTFTGVNHFKVKVGRDPFHNYYRFSEISTAQDRMQMTIALGDYIESDCYLSFQFESLIAEDISGKLSKYEK